MSTVKKITSNPIYYTIILIGKLLPQTIKFDEFYLKLLYRFKMKKTLNLKNPKT